MPDEVLRILAVAAAAALAVGVGVAARRREARRFERAPLDLSGVDGTVLLFTDQACGHCTTVRTMLEEAGVDFTEIRYREAADRWHDIGVTGVPLVVVRDAAGETVDVIGGVPNRRRLRRAVMKGGRHK